MLNKSFRTLSCALAIGALTAPAFATSNFYLVVPIPSAAKGAPVEYISVSLAGAELPKAMVSQAYSESLRPYLSVTGDLAFDPAAARWSLAEGTLPAGMVLDAATGTLSGTPTAQTDLPTSFTVLATYKGSDGQAIYTIEVEGVVLTVRSIAAGGTHTCAITNTGGMKCWGNNDNGQLGDNSVTQRKTPVDVVGLGAGVASMAMGDYHTCALMTSGVVKCWGLNVYGQLGDNSTINRRTPVDVVALGAGVASLEANGYHTCAVTTLGAAKCWGANYAGQLGDNSTIQRNSPVDVIGLGSGVARIDAGTSHTCAVTTAGSAKCWGTNSYGQLGDGSTTQRNSPVAVIGLDARIARIAANNLHTCAVTTAGAAKCWGNNDNGQLGDNSITQRTTPVDVVGLGSGVAAITAGSAYTCALTTSGAAKCWGDNYYGSLGDNSTTQRRTPVDVVGLGSEVESISAGVHHTCVLTSSAVAKCWGTNAYGQLGDNSTTNRRTPVDVQGFQ